MSSDAMIIILPNRKRDNYSFVTYAHAHFEFMDFW